MGQFTGPPDLQEYLRTLDARLAAVERQTQQASLPRASIIRVGAAENIATSVTTIPNFDTASFDTAGMWNAAAPSRLTVPYAGVYDVRATVGFTANAAGDRRVTLRRTGADDFTSDFRRAATSTSITTLAGFKRCLAGEYFEVSMFQDSGSTLQISVPVLSVVFLGPV
jgi:hypothetical protein